MKRRLTIALSLLVMFALLPISFGQLSRPVAQAAPATGCTVTPGVTSSLAYVPITVAAGDLVMVTGSGIAAVNMRILLPSMSPTAVTVNSASATAVAAGPGTVEMSSYVFPGPTGVAFSYVITICAGTVSTGIVAATEVPKTFTDGRCNQDADQSVTVYPNGEGGFTFFAVYNSVGYFALTLTKADLDANPDTGEAHMISEAKGVQVWRLAGGALEVRRLKADGGMYKFSLTSC